MKTKQKWWVPDVIGSVGPAKNTIAGSLRSLEGTADEIRVRPSKQNDDRLTFSATYVGMSA